MIRLSKLADYAVVLLAEMVRRDGAVTALQLSAACDLPMPTVAKVLKLLARGGVLEATRGALGGYRLARGATDISVADIITAVDGPIAVAECAEGSAHACASQQGCAIMGRWNRVNAAVRGALASVSLYEMALEMPLVPRKPKARVRAGKTN